MKYFTKEELVDITKELLENPTRETLKNLNEKYNGNSEMEKNLVQESQTVLVEPPVIEPLPTTLIEEKPVVMPNETVIEPLLTIEVEQPKVDQLPKLNIPNMELPKVEPTIDSTNNVVPSFELPKLETPTFNNQNNTPVNFSGNLFDTPSNEIPNLMQTTDNFNAMPNTMPSTEVPVAPAPFFVTNPESVNNPIPVGGPANNVPNQGPSMFGQFEQNYM